MSERKGPVAIELEGPADVTPASAPMVPDALGEPQGRAMQTVVRLTGNKGSGLGGFFSRPPWLWSVFWRPSRHGTS